MNTITKRITTTKADAAWQALNGIFVVFKPASVHMNNVKETILQKLCEDLNSMKVRPPTKRVVIEGPTNDQLRVLVRTNYSDHPLLLGPRYKITDIKMKWLNHLDISTSGVLIGGINRGTKICHMIQDSKPTKFYKIKGIFGQATDTYFKTGKIVEKSTYNHIKRSTIDKICASMQSSHQKKMFDLCGVDIQSQTAYELAAKGLIRPASKEIPVLYSIKCVDYTPPEFTLEIVCINEYGTYLKTLVHDLGIMLHSTATCTQMQCCQYGLFNLEHALLSKHWDLENILANMRDCDRILHKNEFILKQESPILESKSQSVKDFVE